MEETIGAKLKRFREHKNWSQGEMAERCEMSQSYLSEIESGKEPTLRTLRKAAKALDVPISIFFDEGPTRLVALQDLDLPEDANLYLQGQKGLAWAEVIREAEDGRVSPETMRQIIQAIKRDMGDVER